MNSRFAPAVSGLRSRPTPRRRSARVGVAGLLAAGVLVATGCGSSSSDTSSAAEQSTASGAAAPTVITRKVSGYGTVLATPDGKPLFVLTADPSGASSCTGACVKEWPPLLATGAPAAGPGVTASMLGTFTRSDGGKQVLYNKHALYAGKGVSAAGTEADGGTWYLIAPSGDPVETTESGGY